MHVGLTSNPSDPWPISKSWGSNHWVPSSSNLLVPFCRSLGVPAQELDTLRSLVTNKLEVCSQPSRKQFVLCANMYSTRVWPMWLKISNIYHNNIRTRTMYFVSNPVRLNPVSLQFTPNYTRFGSDSKWRSEWIPIFPSGPALLSRLLSHLGINRDLFERALLHWESNDSMKCVKNAWASILLRTFWACKLDSFCPERVVALPEQIQTAAHV